MKPNGIRVSMKTSQDFRCDSISIAMVMTIVWLLIGCGTTQSNVDRNIPTGIQDGEAIVVFLDSESFDRDTIYNEAKELHGEKYWKTETTDYSWGSQSPKKEKWLSNCISKGFKTLNKKIEVFPSAKFRLIFNDLNLPEDWSTSKAIVELLNNPKLLEKEHFSGIHYIISAKYFKSEYHSTLSSGGYEAGWYVQGSVTATINIEVDVFDIKGKCLAGHITTITEATGKTGAAGYLIVFIPYGYPAMPESNACEEFGEAVAGFIIGDEIEK